jgi:hypothetical protein
MKGVRGTWDDPSVGLVFIQALGTGEFDTHSGTAPRSSRRMGLKGRKRRDQLPAPQTIGVPTPSDHPSNELTASCGTSR